MMKKILLPIIFAVFATAITISVYASQPQISEGENTVTVSNISKDDLVFAAVFDQSRILEGVRLYRNQTEVSVDYNTDIFANYPDADYVKLFVWLKNQEPQMTSYGLDIKKYKAQNPKADKLINITVGENTVTATLADNTSAQAFYELLEQGAVTVDMHDYGNFEKVGNLPISIVPNDTMITTEPGDIILYQGNQITIYYDTNTWNFTRLGKVNGLTPSELKAILGSGNITAVFSVAK